jgi:hypothetical protein
MTGVDGQVFHFGKAFQGFENSGAVSAGQVCPTAAAGKEGVTGKEGVLNLQADRAGGMSRVCRTRTVKLAKCKVLPSP